MSKLLNKITSKLTGVEKSRPAPYDSEVRKLFNECSLYEEDFVIAERYKECSICDQLKEEFRFLGVKIKDMTPTCGACGCNLNVKIPMEGMSCPEGKW